MTKGQIIIAAIVNVGFIGLTIVYFYRPESLPSAVTDQASMITGCWIANFTTVINWFFGSSKGSSDKTSLLKPR